VKPNLMGIPAEFRPLLLPDEGCRFLYPDYAQQEPGIAGWLTGDAALLHDFASGDVYTNLGQRMGIVTPEMSPDQVRSIRNRVLKELMLSIIYGKSVFGIARDRQCSLHEAQLHFEQFRRTYPCLFAWLMQYVATSLQKGWAQNVI